mgnify:FL=1|tara:strand:+ start:17 stop:1264 length:1248 start_codon:yes stop_codon:yes gene_type:complete
MTLPPDLLTDKAIRAYARPSTKARIGEAIGRGFAGFSQMIDRDVQRRREIERQRQQQSQSRLAEQMALAEFKHGLGAQEREAQAEAARAKREAARLRGEREAEAFRRKTQISNIGGRIQNLVRKTFAANKELDPRVARDVDDIAKSAAEGWAPFFAEKGFGPEDEENLISILNAKFNRFNEAYKLKDKREKKTLTNKQNAANKKAAIEAKKATQKQLLELRKESVTATKPRITRITELQKMVQDRNVSTFSKKIAQILGTQGERQKELKSKKYMQHFTDNPEVFTEGLSTLNALQSSSMVRHRARVAKKIRKGERLPFDPDPSSLYNYLGFFSNAIKNRTLMSSHFDVPRKIKQLLSSASKSSKEFAEGTNVNEYLSMLGFSGQEKIFTQGTTIAEAIEQLNDPRLAIGPSFQAE